MREGIGLVLPRYSQNPAELAEEHLRRIDAQVTLDRLALYTWSDDRRLRQFKIVKQHIFGH